MKTYEEKLQSVLGKIEEQKALKKKRRKTISIAASFALSLSFVIVLGFAGMKGGLLKYRPEQAPGETDIVMQHPPTQPIAETGHDNSATSEKKPDESSEGHSNSTDPEESLTSGTSEPTERPSEAVKPTVVTEPTENIPVVSTDAPQTETAEPTEGIPEGPSESTEQSPPSSGLYGFIIIDGKMYDQIDGNAMQYSRGTYLGRATDFAGYYSDQAIDGDLYRSAEDVTVLLLYLDSGEVHILMCFD